MIEDEQKKVLEVDFENDERAPHVSIIPKGYRTRLISFDAQPSKEANSFVYIFE